MAFPIYTKDAECQDCYKCVRECPVKAINIEKSHASVNQDLCILCGHCVRVCPVKAKRVASDSVLVMKLVSEKKTVVSLAPSFVSEFEDIAPKRFIASLKKLGFDAVSETSIGAEIISSQAKKYMENFDGALISSACPAVVNYVGKYFPSILKNVSPLLSPMNAHAKMLKETMGDINVVFIGPCIAKKKEASDYGYVDASLTFAEIADIFIDNDIDIYSTEYDEEDAFVPYESSLGALYPIEGGMLAGVRKEGTGVSYESFSGMEMVEDSIKAICKDSEFKAFVELLACTGGCVNGPGCVSMYSVLKKRQRVVSYKKSHSNHKSKSYTNSDTSLLVSEIPVYEHTAQEIAHGLSRVGKFSKNDELNCGGCGYDTCRDFATALLESRAEETMCVSYMRKLAQRKAEALLKSIPSGVVIVDENMRIVDSNFAFATLTGSELEYEASDSLVGLHLPKIFDNHAIFHEVLNGAKDRDIIAKVDGKTLRLLVFSIESGKIVGGIIEDITEPSVRKDEVIKRTKAVIEKNLAVVQQIAYLLGENAAETELTLKSVIDIFNVSDD